MLTGQFKGRNFKPPYGAKVNWSHPLSRGLMACWLFNEGRGSVAHDIVGHYDGVIPGTQFTWVNNLRGGIALDGAPTGTNRVNIPVITVGNSYTVEWWIYSRGLPSSGYYAIISNAAGTRGIWTHGRFPQFGYECDLAGGTVANSSIDNSANIWNHGVLAVSPLVTSRMYDNGVQDTSNYPVNSVEAGWTNLYNDSSEALQGMLDVLRIWQGRTLTQAEILQLYADPWAMFTMPSRIYSLLPSSGVALRAQGPAVQVF